MTRWPPADLPGLHVDLGERARGGRWLHYPAADFRCGRCGWTDHATGDAVAQFTATVPAHHLAHCPNQTKDI
ncbi:hypothetical protein ACLIYP_05450 [Streptomyces nanhaiensis]|uniref:hypothetical protein n=1 Tax=Streptomyces nanhaiensis TaxID=679319 RepID=UPI00399C68A5